MPALAAGLSLGEYVRSLGRRLAALTAVLLVAIWALTGQGYFWPAWAWLGLGTPVLLDAGAVWAWRHPRGRGAPGGVRVGADRGRGDDPDADVAADVAAGGGSRVLAGVGAAGPRDGGQRVLAVRAARSGARGRARRRALRARIDLLTRTRRQAVDAQAAELRRIERDLHDGAQARLVALTLQLGRAELRLEDQPRGAALVHEAQREARYAIAELRDLARGIVPPLLADRGLLAAVQSLGGALRPRHGDPLRDSSAAWPRRSRARRTS